MTNQEQVAQTMKILAESDQKAREIIWDRGEKRLVAQPIAPTEGKDQLKIAPEDMIVSALA